PNRDDAGRHGDWRGARLIPNRRLVPQHDVEFAGAFADDEVAALHRHAGQTIIERSRPEARSIAARVMEDRHEVLYRHARWFWRPIIIHEAPVPISLRTAPAQREKVELFQIRVAGVVEHVQ